MNYVCPSQSLYCMRKQHSEPLNSTKFYLGVVGYIRSDQIWKPGVKGEFTSAKVGEDRHLLKEAVGRWRARWLPVTLWGDAPQACLGWSVTCSVFQAPHSKTQLRAGQGLPNTLKLTSVITPRETRPPPGTLKQQLDRLGKANNSSKWRPCPWKRKREKEEWWVKSWPCCCDLRAATVPVAGAQQSLGSEQVTHTRDWKGETTEHGFLGMKNTYRKLTK